MATHSRLLLSLKRQISYPSSESELLLLSCLTNNRIWLNLWHLWATLPLMLSRVLTPEVLKHHGRNLTVQRQFQDMQYVGVLFQSLSGAQLSTHPNQEARCMSEALWTLQTSHSARWTPASDFGKCHMKQKNYPDKPCPEYSPKKSEDTVVNCFQPLVMQLFLSQK